MNTPPLLCDKPGCLEIRSIKLDHLYFCKSHHAFELTYRLVNAMYALKLTQLDTIKRTVVHEIELIKNRDKGKGKPNGD